jgi:putative CocE/NonD family hydrolase
VWRDGLAALLTITAAFAATAGPKEEHYVVRVAMRDGVKLSTRVSRFASASKLPTILIRTPYGKGAELPKWYHIFLERGYAVVMQDVRGRSDSEGTFRSLEQEGSDGSDTINWIARQPWSNGNVGMIGGSYVGMVQWKAALTGNPHLKAIFPVVSGCDEFRDRYYSTGGALKIGHRLLWLAENLRAPGFVPPPFPDYARHMPLRTADKAATGRRIDSYQAAMNHPYFDAFWKGTSTREKLERMHVPVFAVGGWYDNYVQSDLEAFSILSNQSQENHIIVGPWPHDMSQRFAGVDFGQDWGAPIRRYQLEWFDHWLKPAQRSSQLSLPPMQIFVMGANRWRNEHEWPLARTHYTPYYLAGRAAANSANGEGQLAPEPHRNDIKDNYTYDPRKPVPTTGGAVCCNPKLFPWGPKDQRPVEARSDVLVYTSPPLKTDVEVTGPIRVLLYVSSTAADTDFTAKLVDVFPDGYARNLTDGILRLRYRESLEHPVAGKPGSIYPIVIDAGVTSNTFKAGHRIRLDISSSNFPRFDRNPNTGRPIADETELRAAAQTVYRGRQYPSHVLLPVIP